MRDCQRSFSKYQLNLTVIKEIINVNEIFINILVPFSSFPFL